MLQSTPGPVSSITAYLPWRDDGSGRCGWTKLDRIRFLIPTRIRVARRVTALSTGRLVHCAMAGEAGVTGAAWTIFLTTVKSHEQPPAGGNKVCPLSAFFFFQFVYQGYTACVVSSVAQWQCH
jgi:hypothetical protein